MNFLRSQFRVELAFPSGRRYVQYSRFKWAVRVAVWLNRVISPGLRVVVTRERFA